MPSKHKQFISKKSKMDENVSSNTTNKRITMSNVKNVLKGFVSSEVKDRYNVNVSKATNSLLKGNSKQAISNVRNTLTNTFKNKLSSQLMNKYGVNASKPLNSLAKGNSLSKVASNMRQPIANTLISQIKQRVGTQPSSSGGAKRKSIKKTKK